MRNHIVTAATLVLLCLAGVATAWWLNPADLSVWELIIFTCVIIALLAVGILKALSPDRRGPPI